MINRPVSLIQPDHAITFMSRESVAQKLIVFIKLLQYFSLLLMSA